MGYALQALVSPVNSPQRTVYANQLFGNPRFLDDYPAGVTITTSDASATIVYVNQALCQMIGASRAELIGDTPRSWQGDLTDADVIGDLRQAMRERQPWYGSTVNYRRGGTPFVMEWMMFPIYDEEDRLINWAAVQHDVTERLRGQPIEQARHFAREAQHLSVCYFEFLAAYEHVLAQLAAELHDNVGQELLLLSRRLNQLAEQTARQPRLRQELIEVQQQAVELSQQLRHIMHKARPQALSDFGLGSAVEELCRRMSKSTGVGFQLTVVGQLRRLGAEVETNLYRILQEAFSNVVKHAQARHAQVQLLFLPNAVEIVVSDDGLGLPPEQTRRTGVGLRSMAHRATSIGATLSVTAMPGGGTRLLLSYADRPLGEKATSRRKADDAVERDPPLQVEPRATRSAARQRA